MSTLLGLMLLALLAVASWTDLASRRILNAVPAAVALLWLAAPLAGVPAQAPLASIVGASAVLAAGMLVWRVGWIGGGDVKLLAALSLWAGPEFLVPFLLVTSLAGGALAAALLWYRRFGFTLTTMMLAALRQALHPLAMSRSDGRVWAVLPTPPATLPYGVAIAAGGCWLVLRLTFA
jgi:prepilin peptidase CpaA